MEVQTQFRVDTGRATPDRTPRAPHEYPVEPGPSGEWQDTWQEDRVPLDVEVCLDPNSTADLGEIRAAVAALLSTRTLHQQDGPVLLEEGENSFLESNVESITVVDTAATSRSQSFSAPLLFWQIDLRLHVFQLNEEGGAEADDNPDDVSSYKEWELPSREFHQVWESLVYDTDIKQRLLCYAQSALLFSDRGVNPALISWNRVVLLQGPPGTGKTSLCKALAQKLAIRLVERYPHSVFVEVNAHSLFSKWFSESGKLVSRLFARIIEMVEEEDCLVFVLIDEIESLTSARKAAVSGSEPADAIRAVNALLTQLDGLKRYPNVIVLTTSNICEAIDLAFVDRADIKAHIGNPSLRARLHIIISCIGELQRAGIILAEVELPEPSQAAMLAEAVDGQGTEAMDEAQSKAATALLEVAQQCDGFSGRTLRKLPFLAHACLREASIPAAPRYPAALPSTLAMIAALKSAVEAEKGDRNALYG